MSPASPDGVGLRILELRCAVYEAVTTEDIKKVFRALVKKACEGHYGAGRLVMTYLIGKPGALPIEISPSAPAKSAAAPGPAPAGAARPPSANGSNPGAAANSAAATMLTPSANGLIPDAPDALPLGNITDILRENRAILARRKKKATAAR